MYEYTVGFLGKQYKKIAYWVVYKKVSIENNPRNFIKRLLHT